jgi:ABC-type multidrug transport system fused ATPase/permease subunit
LLDDSLSAVDSHVGRHIFERAIGPRGMLSNKTRIFVTNSLSFLPQCYHILLIDDGKIQESGDYHDLVQKNGLFTEFISTYLITNKGRLNLAD